MDPIQECSPPPTTVSEWDTESTMDLTQDARGLTGWAQSRAILTGSPVYRRESVTSEDSESLAREDSNTGRYSSSAPERLPYQPSVDYGNPYLDTGNLQDPPQPNPTFGRTTPELVNPSNLERGPSEEMSLLTGLRFVLQLLPESLTRSPMTFTYVFITRSAELGLTIFSRLQSSEQLTSSGAELGLASQDGLGPRQERLLMLRIRAPSFGVGMLVARMLSSMNFEARSIYPTYYAGWTGIRCVLSLREDPIR